MIVFPHCPRTCGTAFKNRVGGIVATVYGCGHARTNVDHHLVINMAQEQLEPLQFLAGHFGRCVRSILPMDISLVTMLRDPLQRTVSYYRFVKATPPHYLHGYMGEMSLKEAILDPIIGRVLCNAQARYIAIDVPMREYLEGMTDSASIHFALESWDGLPSQDLLDISKHVLENEFTAFGIAEAHRRSTNHILRAVGLPEHPPVEGHMFVDRVKELDGDTIQLLVELNSVDIALYNFARDLFYERTNPPNGSDLLHDL